MAIFTHLIPAKHRRRGKRDMTSGRDDTTGRRRQRRRHCTNDNGHNGHHGNNW
ncbi:hypothetical protein OG311_04715 [Streptomyces sp. NBC_01343]|uniref:hypothetical protein n=1 Tax=Streptomyces sp. NBC_01343 TaxID=2903832 RepID=UPI002E14B937|nr:hypothetical protein OG311_04715 [Streptomyces sp. NBC_01343]